MFLAAMAASQALGYAAPTETIATPASSVGLLVIAAHRVMSCVARAACRQEAYVIVEVPLHRLTINRYVALPTGGIAIQVRPASLRLPVLDPNAVRLAQHAR